MKGGAQAIAALAPAKLARPYFKMSYKLDLSSLHPLAGSIIFALIKSHFPILP